MPRLLGHTVHSQNIKLTNLKGLWTWYYIFHYPTKITVEIKDLIPKRRRLLEENFDNF